MAKRVSTSRRQYLREYALDVVRRAIKKQFCGNTSSGANVWPFSRRIRRSMERDRAKREFLQTRNLTI